MKDPQLEICAESYWTTLKKSLALIVLNIRAEIHQPRLTIFFFFFGNFPVEFNLGESHPRSVVKNNYSLVLTNISSALQI